MSEARSFEDRAGAIPAQGSNSGVFFTEADWLQLRDRALTPTACSELVTDQRTRAEFAEGARLLRLAGETARPGQSPLPQQLLIADMLAAGHKRNAILLPRRSTKTTSIFAVGIGRAAMREDYRIAYLPMTTGKAGRQRFHRDVVPAIERLYPDKATRPVKVNKTAGLESLTFPESGGFMAWLSSLEDIRGEAFDLVILDEAGETKTPADGIEALAAALPTLDTRPGAQLVVLGTAGRYRTGNLLWDSLELGRSGIGGIVEYAFPDTTSEDELASWEPGEETPEGRVRELVELTHPGLAAGLTTLDSIRDNYHSTPVTTFAREYGGIFEEEGASGRLVSASVWETAALDDQLPEPPAEFALAAAAHPDGLCASIVAAWKAPDGTHRIGVLEARGGTQWLSQSLYKLSRKYGTAIVYDSGSQALAVEVEQLNRANPRPRMEPVDFRGVRVAASKLLKALTEHTVKHYRQDELDAAAQLVVKRKAGTAGGWALGRTNPGDDITALEAAALALHSITSRTTASRPRSVVVT